MTENRQSKKRIEEIRQRRSQQEEKTSQSKRRTRKNVSMPTAPPVMVRNTHLPSSNLHVSRKKSQKVKRRYDFALNTPGAEMSLPSLPQIRLDWRIASFLLAVILGYVLYYFWTSPIYKVAVSEISGLEHVNLSDINSVLRVSGKQVFELDAAEIEKELVDSFPEFSTVSVVVDFPATLAISVTERIPVLLWRQESRSKFVDEEGMTFPVRDEISLTTIPTITALGDPPALENPIQETNSLEIAGVDFFSGENPLDLPVEVKAEPFLSPEMVKAILMLQESAPSGAELIYDPSLGFSWKDQRGWDVYFGDLGDMEMKLSLYVSILDHLKAEDTPPSLINVAFVHAPYYRLDKEDESNQ